MVNSETTDRAKGNGTLDPARARTILLVEDDAELRTMLEILFEDRGYHLLVAEDGKAGWKVAKGHAGPIDLLLSDIVMPGMTGVELAQRINVMRPKTKVLLVSAYHQADQLIERSWNFLSKPYKTKALIVKIEELLADAEGTGA